MPTSHLEIACFNIESAYIAARSGASRIELCSNPNAGGTTPEIEADALLGLKKELGIPIFIMIRPHGGRFEYNKQELELMKSDIRRLREAADGFVFGILDENNMVEVDSNLSLILEANGKPCTMHKAFDETPDLHEALESVVRCGFSAVLSSGGAETALAGLANLKHLIDRAGKRITIMPGGSIRRDNIVQIKTTSFAQWFHSAAKSRIGNNDLVDPQEVAAILSQL